MGQRIKCFSNGAFLEYDRGSFDDWCVYFTDACGYRKPPHDTEYFSQLKTLSEQFGVHKVYGDYIKLYDMTGTQPDEKILNCIGLLSKSYGASALQAEIIFSILYMTMIAEERKANTRLGKRIKRLGIHKLLVENYTVDEAANFMRGMRWHDIAYLCEERGF